MGIRLVLGAVMVGAAGAKLASPKSGQEALAGFGFASPSTQVLGFWSLVAAEVALGVGVLAGSTEAAIAGAALMAMFALLMIGAILRGKAGQPCGCFGARSRIGWSGVARNFLLAAGFVAVAALDSEDLTTDQWLGLGLIGALVACAGLGAATLALAREVGLLRMRVGPGSALEIAHEGPEIGSLTDIGARIQGLDRKELGLAVFTSEGCHVCQAMKPAVDTIAAHPAVAVGRFDEVADREAWGSLDVPGSPYAVAIDPQGVVLAKGTFNNLAQLESILGSGERRKAGEVARV